MSYRIIASKLFFTTRNSTYLLIFPPPVTFHTVLRHMQVGSESTLPGKAFKYLEIINGG